MARRVGKNGRLIIFDCDGVLVDSEPIAFAVLLEGIAAAGGRIEPEIAWRRFLGRSMAAIVKELADDFGLSFDAAASEAMRAELFARFRRELKPVHGVAEALAAIDARRCVASSSQPERIRLALEVTGLLDRFQPHIYSSTMVARGKPAPDLFLHAAAAMGAAPTDCVVIEDSPAGVEAAHAAGMRVFAFTGASHALAAPLGDMLAVLQPDAVFSDMRALPAMLAALDAPGAA